MNFLKASVLTGVTVALLAGQVAFVRADGVAGLSNSAWRFWDDLVLAIARYVDATSGQPSKEGEGQLDTVLGPYRNLVVEKVANFEVEPHQFWRKVPDKQFRKQLRPFSQPENEDPGRSLLLLVTFHVLGGVGPYMLLWLGVFWFIPALFWLMYEMAVRGMMVAGVAFGALVGFSPFWYESLSLPHSAFAFYLTAFVAVAAYGTGALIPSGRQLPRGRSLLIRTVALSAILLGSIWCRSGAVFLVPVGALLATAAFRRAGESRTRAVALAVALLLVPTLLFRPPQTHNIWLPLWEGLGDFGSERGYSWYDVDAGKFLATQGYPLRTELRYVSAEEEGVFRRAFLQEVWTSPLWYGKILVRRVGATLGLTHLSPYGPRDGNSRRTPLFHYKYTTPLDWFGFKDRQAEVPVSVLYLPTLLLAGWTVLRGKGLPALSIVASLAVAALPVPVLISTASGLETQAIGVAYFLGAAFLLQRVADSLVWERARA